MCHHCLCVQSVMAKETPHSQQHSHRAHARMARCSYQPIDESHTMASLVWTPPSPRQPVPLSRQHSTYEQRQRTESVPLPGRCPRCKEPRGLWIPWLLGHGCPRCHPNHRDRHSKFHPDRTILELYEATQQKHRLLRQHGYHLQII